MILAMTGPTLTKVTNKILQTSISASALSAGLILLILLLGDTPVSSFRQAFETILFAFPSGMIGANVYIYLAAKLSVLGRVTRTNLAATLKALLIVASLGTVLSVASIALGAPHEAQVWIFVEILLSCIFSDVAYVRARRMQEFE